MTMAFTSPPVPPPPQGLPAAGVPLKVWPALTDPKLAWAGPVQVKSPASLPLPPSCRESLAAVSLDSSTPMSMLVMPLAGLSTAVSVPS
jgi:hypothetical protein